MKVDVGWALGAIGLGAGAYYLMGRKNKTVLERQLASVWPHVTMCWAKSFENEPWRMHNGQNPTNDLEEIFAGDRVVLSVNQACTLKVGDSTESLLEGSNIFTWPG